VLTTRPPLPSRRRAAFLAAVGSAYLASWLLPVGHAFRVGDVPGWAAFAPALHLCRYREMTSASAVAWLASAWTNVVFVLSFVSVAVRARVPSGVPVWALTVATAFNLLYWTCAQGANLRSGFYLWVFSFGCLAVGAHIFGAGGRAVRRPDHF
jgi:hypothetical protein